MSIVHTMSHGQGIYSEYAGPARYGPSVVPSPPPHSHPHHPHPRPHTAPGPYAPHPASSLRPPQPYAHHHPPHNYPHRMDTIIAEPSYDGMHDSDGSEVSAPAAGPGPGSDALTQATKNLIALDSGPAASWAAAYHKLQQQQQQRKGSLPYSPFARPGPGASLPPIQNPNARPHGEPHLLGHPSHHIPAPHAHSHYSFLPPPPAHSPYDDPARRAFEQEAAARRTPVIPPPRGGSSSASDLGATAPSIPKAALLTPSQKKANHIQSEQKRRANIKAGYEALCETIPALREAIRAEEEAAAASAVGGRKRNSRAAKPTSASASVSDDGTSVAGDKADGRAGPRSENVVLQKTIEHLRAQLDEREALKQRLQRAHSTLPKEHPLMHRQAQTPPWEVVWDGGKLDEDSDVSGDEQP